MTDLSPREKELVEAARLARDTFRHMALDSIADNLEQALRAYDPPKREYPIPSWEELVPILTEANILTSEAGPNSVVAGNIRLSKAGWDILRNATSKEVKP